MRTGIVIVSYNRPNYLKKCFDSIIRSRIPNDTLVVIYDDCSSDVQTNRLIDEFNLGNCEVVKIKNSSNKGICHNLLYGFTYCFQNGCDIVMNLDSDTVVRNDFFDAIISLKKMFPERIITGFHSDTKNKDGSDRHKIINTTAKYFEKQSVGGLNMCLSKNIFDNYLKEILQRVVQKGGNWDYLICKKMFEDNKPIICTRESVCEHIGDVSSMGHNQDKPDKAYNFKPLALKNVTLIGVDCNHVNELEHAIEVSAKHIQFGSIKLLSSMDSGSPHLHRINHLASKAAYNQFVLKELVNYIETDYFIICQGDGYIINWEAWNDCFYNYDYIGARWYFNHSEYPNCNVGNGGLSWRSKHLHKILRDDKNIIPKNDRYINNSEEDHNISKIYRNYLEEKYYIKFAPPEIADKFSIEAYGVKPPNNKYKNSFGFHGFGNIDWADAKIEYIPKRIYSNNKTFKHAIRNNA